ncbi:hypothetical protein KEM48_014106 [Puccinia striiformis f. sp. tritici PST-130]|nr:hypothetical protein KEM48_014106 [Puccinia striiformis f. sp. tritici PST-130]
MSISFATLVIEKDRSLFQNRHIDDIPNAELRVPDDVEVHRKMARVARAPPDPTSSHVIPRARFLTSIQKPSTVLLYYRSTQLPCYPLIL